MLLFTQLHSYPALPVILEPNFASLFFSMVMALAVGLGLDHLLLVGHVARGVQMAMLSMLVAGLVLVWPPQPAISWPLEYEDAVKAYQTIVQNLQRFNWTIVAPTEQRSQALFVGWHEELGHFLLKVDPEEFNDPEFQLYIPTSDIFLYVEKIPLHSTEPIQPDPNSPMNFEGIKDPEILWQRYHMPDQRRYMHQRLWALAEAYAKLYPTNTTIFFESDRLRVYRIHQPEIKKDVLPTSIRLQDRLNEERTIREE